MAYLNSSTSPTEVEFQYYRSVNAHSATQMGDQVFVYKLNQSKGWSVTTREASPKQIKAGTNGNLSVSWSSNVVTIDGGLPAVSAADNGKILKVVIDANGSYNTLSGYPKVFDSRNYNNDLNKTLLRAQGEFYETIGAMCKRDDRQKQFVVLLRSDGLLVDSQYVGELAEVEET